MFNNYSESPSIYHHTDPLTTLPLPIPIQNQEAYNAYRQIIKDNIDYDCLIHDKQRYSKENLDEIVELMVETICSTKDTIRVNGEDIPANIVSSRFLKLDFSHIAYVFDCLDKNTTKVHNIRNYLLTTLYNSFTLIGQYYKSVVNHDLLYRYP